LLTEFNVNFWDFGAHVGMAGGGLTPPQLAIEAIAGVTLPLLVWAIFIGFVPRKANFTLEALKLASTVVVLNTLLAWILIPFLSLFGKAPASDDVISALRYSQMAPLLLTMIALIVYILGWVYFLSRIDGLENELLLFHLAEGKMLTSGMQTVIVWMTGIMAFCLMLVFLVNGSAATNPPAKLLPPAGFEVVAEVKLSRQTYSAETLAEFTLEEPAVVGIFIVVRDINTSYFDLSLIGPAGYRSVILHGEDYRADRDGGLWEEKLLPGTYQSVLTSHQSPGTAAIFLKTP
jgi:hypothetical protein